MCPGSGGVGDSLKCVQGLGRAPYLIGTKVDADVEVVRGQYTDRAQEVGQDFCNTEPLRLHFNLL